jgi:hypothetical protein
VFEPEEIVDAGQMSFTPSIPLLISRHDPAQGVTQEQVCCDAQQDDED